MRQQTGPRTSMASRVLDAGFARADVTPTVDDDTAPRLRDAEAARGARSAAGDCSR